MPKNHTLILVIAVAVSSTALFAQDQTPSSGEKHKIAVETDSGRYEVGAEKLDPKQLGVAIYPGAKIHEGENDSSDASLSLDWGKESTRLYLQNYVTSDSSDKVLSFYRKQLSKYGAVLECRNGKPVAAAPWQLKCDSDKDGNSIELKAGTERKQHMVGVTSTAGGAQFEVVYLDETPRSVKTDPDR
ncbi:MAG: hypothetical protein WB711_03085 [Terriglobales bacterium]